MRNSIYHIFKLSDNIYMGKSIKDHSKENSHVLVSCSYLFAYFTSQLPLRSAMVTCMSRVSHQTSWEIPAYSDIWFHALVSLGYAAPTLMLLPSLNTLLLCHARSYQSFVCHALTNLLSQFRLSDSPLK